MNSFFDTLATVLEAGSSVSLTTVDRRGDVHTQPARALRGPFRGQLWLQLNRDQEFDATITDGCDATVSFSGAAEGPYVTVKGWAVLLPAEELRGSTMPTSDPLRWHRDPGRPSPLVCLTATAAQLWESLSGGDPRIFAFPATDPHRSDREPTLSPASRAVNRAIDFVGTAHSG